MKSQRLPKWVAKYQDKITRLKRKMAFMLLCWIFVGILLLILSLYHQDFHKISLPVGGIGSIIVLIIFFTGMATKMRYRQHDAYYIVFYVGFFQNALIIEDVIQDNTGFESSYFGKLPDGTKVTVCCKEGIQFNIGDSQNLTQF